jgi:hypothetical protein
MTFTEFLETDAQTHDEDNNRRRNKSMRASRRNQVKQEREREREREKGRSSPNICSDHQLHALIQLGRIYLSTIGELGPCLLLLPLIIHMTTCALGATWMVRRARREMRSTHAWRPGWILYFQRGFPSCVPRLLF